jgi:hypothetical protein
MTVVDLNGKRLKKRRDPRSLEQATGAARFFGKMVREIENDLGGRRQLSRIEGELIRAFCGAATQVQYLNHQVMLGEGSEIDLRPRWHQPCCALVRGSAYSVGHAT